MPLFGLGPIAAGRGYRVLGYETVGSTMTEAANAARSGDAGDLWVAALEQTAGRGRRGRQWQTIPGNLAASLLVEPGSDPAVTATLGFVAGVALHRALLETVERAIAATLRLKWPNDVLAGDAKLAGILLEATPLSGGRQGVIVGIGVNVVAAPEGLPYPATALATLGSRVTAPVLFSALAENWCLAFETWNRGRGLQALLADWRPRAFGLGGPVRIERETGMIAGTFESVDDEGRLVLRAVDGGRTAISAGDVHFGTARSVRS